MKSMIGFESGNKANAPGKGGSSLPTGKTSSETSLKGKNDKLKDYGKRNESPDEPSKDSISDLIKGVHHVHHSGGKFHVSTQGGTKSYGADTKLSEAFGHLVEPDSGE